MVIKFFYLIEFIEMSSLFGTRSITFGPRCHYDGESSLHGHATHYERIEYEKLFILRVIEKQVTAKRDFLTDCREKKQILQEINIEKYYIYFQ